MIQSLRGFVWISVAIETYRILCVIRLQIVYDLSVPYGAVIFLVAGMAFVLGANARITLPNLKGNIE
ncbi:hypothetical protein EWW49_28135 [Pseudomonas syringae]|nr:hypothetical protein EWW49_28135 [Pseudomonas syringae]